MLQQMFIMLQLFLQIQGFMITGGIVGEMEQVIIIMFQMKEVILLIQVL